MRQLRIPKSEYHERQQELLSYAHSDGYDGMVVFSALNIHYLSGMYHLPTERPCVLGVTDEQVEIVVPRLEKPHSENEHFAIDKSHVYFDYPQGKPMQQVAKMCESLDISDKQIAVDMDGSPGRNGYRGPSLSDVVNAEIDAVDYITDMREVKSDAELDLIREASVWANYGHRLLQDKIEPGRRPVTISAEVATEGTETMLDTLGERYEQTSASPPMSCMFTTGDVTYTPHSVNGANRIKEGDNIVSIVKPTVGGYTTELERTMFVGEPSSEQQDYFAIMQEAQEIALGTIAPGVKYATVEDEVVSYFEEQGVKKYTQHHVGHNIGLQGHERPFLDVAYDGEIREGELYTVEPGFYVPDIGGFRHSDTVVVTEDGVESYTYYPRDIEQLTIDL